MGVTCISVERRRLSITKAYPISVNSAAMDGYAKWGSVFSGQAVPPLRLDGLMGRLEVNFGSLPADKYCNPKSLMPRSGHARSWYVCPGAQKPVHLPSSLYTVLFRKSPLRRLDTKIHSLHNKHDWISCNSSFEHPDTAFRLQQWGPNES